MTGRTLIDEFVRKQKFGAEDKSVQLDCIQEELAELVYARVFGVKQDELEEAIDVLVTVFVYLRMLEFSWDEVDAEFKRKMLVNTKKPVRKEKGVKVSKR